MNALMRMHWRKQMTYRKSWYEQVYLAALEAGTGQPKLKRARITITTHAPAKILDEDNFWGGCKALQDGLVRAGILEDDTSEHIVERKYFQHVTRTATAHGTEILIDPA